MKRIFFKKKFDSRKITENNAHLNGIYFKFFFYSQQQMLVKKIEFSIKEI